MMKIVKQFQPVLQNYTYPLKNFPRPFYGAGSWENPKYEYSIY